MSPENKGLIVLAEDDIGIRGLLEFLLNNAGYGVTSCKNGKEAIDAIKRLTVISSVLTVTDIDMPIMDGFELIGQVQEFYPSIPILAMTGNDNNFPLLRSLKVPYIAKPFRPQVMLDKVSGIIRIPSA